MNIRLPATLFSALLLLLSILPAGRLVAGGGAAPFDPHHPMHDGSLSGSSIAVSDDDDRWDSRFGFPGVEGQVYTIAVDGDQVYIGGSFRYVQSVEANNIVRFDSRTRTFHALGAGTNNHVHSIEVASNGDVYIGGEFTLIGEDTMRGIAHWDGSRWHRFGSGVSGGVGHYGSCVWSIRSVGDLLYIGGDFDTIDGSNINGLAAWNSLTGRWSALGDGTSGIVYALDTLGGDLYAAGELTRAGILGDGAAAPSSISRNKTENCMLEARSPATTTSRTGTASSGSGPDRESSSRSAWSIRPCSSEESSERRTAATWRAGISPRKHGNVLNRGLPPNV